MAIHTTEFLDFGKSGLQKGGERRNRSRHHAPFGSRASQSSAIYVRVHRLPEPKMGRLGPQTWTFQHVQTGTRNRPFACRPRRGQGRAQGRVLARYLHSSWRNQESITLGGNTLRISSPRLINTSTFQRCPTGPLKCSLPMSCSASPRLLFFSNGTYQHT